MNKIFLGIALFSISFTASSQTNGEQDLGAWYMYFGATKISEKLSIHSEVQGRFYNLSNFNQLLIRVGLNYHIDDKAMLTAGYGIMPTESYEKGKNQVTVFENRIWEQFVLKNSIGRVFFSHRYRLEQRWLTSNVAPDTYKNRARYQLLVKIPINNPTLKAKTVYAAIYDEIFMHLESNPFNQNRLYFALGYKINKQIDLQAGYLKNHVKNLTYDRLQFAIFYNPNFTTKD